MRILMPIPHYYPVIGGLETWTKNTAEKLALKNDIFVVTGRVKSFPRKEMLKGVNILRTSLYGLEDLSFSSFFYIVTAFPFIFFQSFFVARKNNIDICHCQGFVSGFLGFLLFKIKKIPYVVTIQKLEKKRDFLRKLVYKEAKACLVASSEVKKYFSEIGVKNIRIIPNGIDLERFIKGNREKSRKELGLKDEFLLISVGRLEPRKGFSYLIKAMKILKKDNVKLFIIGGGQSEKDLKDLIKKLSLEKKITLIGAVSPDQIPQYLKAADCFAMSSLEEGFGIAILEAMASGLPVVATRIGGILDIVKDGENGVLMEPKNSKAIAEAVLRIKNNNDFTQKIIDNAKNKLSNYDWDNIVEEISLIYEEILWKK